MEKTIFQYSSPGRTGVTLPVLDVPETAVPDEFGRKHPVGLPQVTEGQAMRHFVRLSTMNFNIEKGLYPLGSCTMKYNPRLHEYLARIERLAAVHPLSSDSSVQGTLQIMYELGEFFCEITGFDAVTLQPAAGAQGEFTGIMLIKKWQIERGQGHRNEVLMPDSSHGTNPATTTLAGLKVVSVKSDEHGRVDVEDLRSKVGENTCAFMLTNPNTLGIFESNIREITQIVHSAGGLNYMDGANMNALLGIARPGDMGFDACHLNLHKTFSTPHGGGGPGSGAVCCTETLGSFLPASTVGKTKDGYVLNNGGGRSIGRLMAFHGNVGVLYKAYAYIRTLGARGLREASEVALINANYMKARIKEYYEVPNDDGPCMHEFVASGAEMAKKGANTLDIAKRLLDYGFHAPTIYFPLIVKEALMIEPTETESLESIDTFIDAMIAIAGEINEKPHLVTDAPVNTPVLRLDEVKAVKDLCLVEPVEL
ncbi:MAG: aminomethyl-transferring glycine dehydrogenase subunit GcvPB [Candidatus Fermentibacteraceae bacterium]|nr:aminomethyl-transferring glycine dehydrogenase subunit GcvPB [Candidatus Fermentibacteraceae bacterium]